MNVGQAVQTLADRFHRAGIESARLDARLLVAHVLGISPQQVFGYPENHLTADEVSSLEQVSKRRADREPLARITGEKEFWSLTFHISDETLIPRPETETLIDAVLERFPDKSQPLRILDLGTGSGCLLVSLLHELTGASGVGVDISEPALQTARTNARHLGVENRSRFVQNDWGRSLGRKCSGQFDIIVSNPPYIVTATIDRLQREVSAYEPRQALAGGEDGLEAYRKLIPDVCSLLGGNGFLALEIGIGQATDVQALGITEGLTPAGCRQDLAGIDRCVLFDRP